ncbi:hypothetical protein MKX03_016652 [Papaver bracteatum]|nr:hypothetical protein MKX03_016652 [Papaver bracteatum]
MNDKWESVRNFIKNHPCSVEVPITVSGRTTLHISAGAGHSNFVRKLVELMPIEVLELKDSYDGNTSLHLAVIAGLDDAVKVMVQKHRKLTRICNKNRLNPLLNAAIHITQEHTEMLRFLCDVMKDEESSSFQGHWGDHLICSITRADLFGLATYIIRQHPSLATAREDDGNTILNVLAEKARRSQKLRSSAVLELLNIIFDEISCMTSQDMSQFFLGSNFLNTAVKNGSSEIVHMCISIYPDHLWFPHEGRNIFQIVVENRQEKIFDYLYRHMNADDKILITRMMDSNGGNILHVAAKVASPSQLNVCISPVKVEKRVPPALGKMRNDEGETPQEVFTREHKDLVKKAEAYMIRTAESCLVVAALVAIVAFAAAFTLPGGSFSDDSNATNQGKPIFLGKKTFLVFMVADALALFSSTTSILVFLSIFAGNYAEGNFEIILPKKLKRGLGSLIISVVNVIIAFSVTLSIILESRYVWAPYLICVAAIYSLALSLSSLLNLFEELASKSRLMY